MDDSEEYDRARRRVGQLKGFYIHATVFVLVNTLLVIINLETTRREIWFFWPLFG